MCGIAGLFDTKGLRPYAPGLLQQMTDALAHRGPDGAGLHLEPGLALGHRRLAIIDVAGGSQPMWTADRMLTIVFNGEIYNFMDLRRELEAGGAVFRTRSDTEVLLHGWRVWGAGLLPKLRGMFAFALWDARDQALILARDAFGKKPLHYAELPDGTLAFASEIKSLLCVAEVSRELDPEAIEDFFTYGYVPDPKTIYRAIRKLEPAHYLITRKGRSPTIRRYWSILERLDETPARAEEALAERLEAAVTRRLVSDVPLGALLSGGVDSSAVVALMAKAAKGPVKTFSIASSEPDFDESAYAAQVADKYATDHDVRVVDPDDFSLVRRLPQIYDEPFGDVSAIPTFTVCAQARRSVTVALTGDGGDEVLAGYRRHAFHLAAERVRKRVPTGFRRSVFAPLAQAYPRAAWLPRPLRARSTLRELSLDSASAYAAISSALPSETRERITTTAFRQSLGGYDAADLVRDAYNVDAPLDALQRAQYADLMAYLPGDILTKVDRASMANSLELRAPMLDTDFSAWSFGLPPCRKLNRAGGGKAILKQAMEPYLPSELLYRRKQGFTVPLQRWLRGPLRAEIAELADNRMLRDSGVIDAGAIRALSQGQDSGLQDNSKALWLVWVFSAFLAHRPAQPFR
jgi:asparagine synthase (glutamine-hydrolysing)